MAVWFFPTYLILRLAEALPMSFNNCRTLPELWEYQCPKFNLLIRIGFILGLSISHLPPDLERLELRFVLVILHSHRAADPPGTAAETGL